MARPIKMDEESAKTVITDFIAYLKSGRVFDGKISFTHTMETAGRRAELQFSELAWLKMQMLMSTFDTEVAWHGTAYRDEDPEKDTYHIDDIFVYPQEVSAARVKIDLQEYQTWLYNLDDEVFDNLRMHGHSHVNMATFPSSDDLSDQKGIIEQMTDDMFYIFLIWNKRNERTIKIYDKKKNILFETVDIDVAVADTGMRIDEFLKSAKDNVTKGVYSYTKSAGNIYSGTKSYTPAKQEKKEEPKKEEKKHGKKLKKGKRRPQSAAANACDDLPSYSSYGKLYRYPYSDYDYDYDDPDNPYGAFGYR